MAKDFTGKVLILFLSLNFSSCNITQSLINKTEKNYKKMGQVEWQCSLDSATIHMRKIGNGEKKILLVHGFGPVTQMQWEDLVTYLHDDFTMYIPDLIYFGESTSSSYNYDPRFITRQLHNCLQNYGISNLYVAGISYGGLIGSIYAHEYENKVEGLILIDALSKFYDPNYSDSLARVNGYQNMNEILIPSNGRALKKLFELSFFRSKRYPAYLLNKPAKVLYSNQRKEKVELLKFLSDHEKEMKVWDFSYSGRVKIIWGNEDKIIPLSNAEQLNRYYEKSELIILPKTGHVANMESPEEVGEIIKSMIIE